MNGKQAKRLRRAALGLAVVREQSGETIAKEGYTLERRIQPSPSSVLSNSRSRSHPEPDRLLSVTIHVDENSVKGIYKSFKKGVRGA